MVIGSNQITMESVGIWTHVKEEIIREYAKAYTTIMTKQPCLKHSYIDAFAGAGIQVLCDSNKIIHGSPMVALQVKPPFSHYYFIDLDASKIKSLRKLAEGRMDVTVLEGDCNKILCEEVFPKCLYKDYQRALCILDPYNLNPSWEVVITAGAMKTIEVFINFMIMDANRNVLWKRPERVSLDQIRRMNEVWGDDSWRDVAYKNSINLFGEEIAQKQPNYKIVEGYRNRLEKVAGFKYVAKPIEMKNTKGATLYYLLFATNNKTGLRIADDILRKYRTRGIYLGD